MSAPKLCFTALDGKLSKVHMPSLPNAGRDAAHAATNKSPRMESSCYLYPPKSTRYSTELARIEVPIHAPAGVWSRRNCDSLVEGIEDLGTSNRRLARASAKADRLHFFLDPGF